MIRLRAEQLEAFREEMREALADRLSRRGAVRFPERTICRSEAEIRAEARGLAAAARDRGLFSEEDVTLFFDLSMELGQGFEQGPGGAWARELLGDRARPPHERITALRGRALGVEEWDPYRDRARRTVTGRVSRTVSKGPPRRIDLLRQRRTALGEISRRLRDAAGDVLAPEAGPGRETLLQRVERAWGIVQAEIAFRLRLERLAERARGKAAAHRTVTDPTTRKELEREIEGLATRYERTRTALGAHLAEETPRKGSADAEDPCVARIAGDRISEREAVRLDFERRLRVARDLCVASGRADGTDRFAFALELARMTSEALDLLSRNGTRVVVCRGAVTDHRGDLSGGKPRGWPPGFGWAEVPGLFDEARNEVVLATRGHEARRAGRVPRAGDGHGSASLAVHLACHGIDQRSGNPSSAAAFRAARTRDRDALPEYCRQPGSAGREESWAESAARFYSEPEKMKSALPNLHRYWLSGPGGRIDRGHGATTVREAWEVRTTRTQRRSSIGSARLDEEGAVVLDLRASDGRGILGDARLVVPASHPRYGEILDHLGGLSAGETKPVLPWPDRS